MTGYTITLLYAVRIFTCNLKGAQIDISYKFINGWGRGLGGGEVEIARGLVVPKVKPVT
jgi:hypothetical protein